MKSLLSKNDCYEEAVFVVLPTGRIEACNTIASQLFGYDHPDEVIGLQVADLVPDDFRQYFPALITEEHLTGGEYLDRVNKRRNGELFATKILTYFEPLGEQLFVMVHIREAHAVNVEMVQLQQNVEVLRNELLKERNSQSDSHQLQLIRQLSIRFPLLSSKDLEFCELFIKNFSSKQMAEHMHITLEGVFAARKRLRKKMNLARKDDLISVILQDNSSNIC